MSDKQMLEEIKLELSQPQVKKLATGGIVQIKPAMVGKGMPLYVEKKTASKIRRAAMKGKGARLKLSPMEIEGSGLFDVIKKGWNALKKSGVVRPVLKAAAKTVLPALATAVGGPGAGATVAGITGKFADKAVDKLGDVAGFGMKKTRGTTSHASGIRGKGVRARGVKGGGDGALVQAPAMNGDGCETCGGGMKKKGASKKRTTTSSDSSFFMASTSAAMNPPSDAVPPSGAWRTGIWSGGSGILPPGARRR